MRLTGENAKVFASGSAILSGIGQSITRGHVTKPLLVFSPVFQMWEAAPFSTLAISGTSLVDGFGYAPQFVFSEELISDCDLCKWEKVRAYHGILNQMEQGHLFWEDSDQKLKSEVFNWGRCQYGGEHPDQQHVCSHCLVIINQVYPHLPLEEMG